MVRLRKVLEARLHRLKEPNEQLQARIRLLRECEVGEESTFYSTVPVV